MSVSPPCPFTGLFLWIFWMIVPCGETVGGRVWDVSRVLGVGSYLNVCSPVQSLVCHLRLCRFSSESKQNQLPVSWLFLRGSSPGWPGERRPFGFYTNTLNQTSFLPHSTLWKSPRLQNPGSEARTGAFSLASQSTGPDFGFSAVKSITNHLSVHFPYSKLWLEAGPRMAPRQGPLPCNICFWSLALH